MLNSENQVPSSRKLPDRVQIASASIHPITAAQAIQWTLASLETPQPQYVVTANVDHIVRLENPGEFREAYSRADLAIADGKPVVWLSHIQGQSLPARITGVDLFESVCASSDRHNIRLYMLGSTPARSLDAARNLQASHPNLQIVGRFTGLISNETTSEVVEGIRDAKPNLVAVCLGSPKQENWVYRHLDVLPPAVYLCIGGTIDIVSKHVRRAPHWIQDLGLEWMYRLIQEPKRLWRRYMQDDRHFLGIVFRQSRRRLQRAFRR